MTYKLKYPAFGRFFSVPCGAVDNFIKTADGDFYKVLLCALCSDSPVADTAQLAERAGVSPAAAEDAMLFWLSHGVLEAEQTDGTQLPAALPATAPVTAPVTAPAAVPKPAEPEKPEKTAPAKVIVKYSPKDIAERISESREVSEMFDQVQKILGKTINTTEAGGLLALYEYFGFSVPSIMILTQYTVGIGKGKMRYIETVAREWFDRGITEYADVEKEINRLTELRKNENRIKRLLHLDSLRPTKEQEQMFSNWVAWGFSDDMIELADEKCRKAIFKTDPNYINGILKRWHEDGVLTPADAAANEKHFADSKKQSSDYEHSSSLSIEEWYRQAESLDFGAVSFKEDDSI